MNYIFKRVMPVIAACALSASFSSLAADRVPLVVSTQQRAALGVVFAPIEQVGALRLTAQASVTTPPQSQAVIAAPVAGRVEQVRVSPGSAVRRGDALATVSSGQLAELRRGLHEASSQAGLAQDSLRRDTALYEEGIIPLARLKATQARAAEASAGLAARRAELASAGVGAEGGAQARLSSPLAGTVIEAKVLPGQRFDAGEVLFRVADTAQLLLDIAVSADKAAAISAGDRVEIASRDALARVLSVSQVVDASQTAHVRAQVERRGSLRVGETLSVSVLTRAAAADAGPRWRVPTRALVLMDGRSVVFVAAPEGVAVVPVAVLSSDDDSAVLGGALSAQDRVAVNGVAALKALASGAR